jgi:peptidoglycan lytic transglycosylase
MRCSRANGASGVVLVCSSIIVGGCGVGPAAPPIAPDNTWAASVAAVSAPKYGSLGPRVAPVREPRKAAPMSGSLPKGGGYRKVGKPYLINGVRYVPRHDPNYEEIGRASWYGDGFHGKKTANGEVYDMHALTAAHRTLPLPSFASITNLQNGRKVMVRVNDRGPFKKGRIIDVSSKVAKELGFHEQGTARVQVKYLGPAPLDGSDRRERTFLAKQKN